MVDQNLQKMFPGMDGDLLDTVKPLKKVNAMRAIYGKRDDEICGNCKDFYVHWYHDKKYFKCLNYRLSRGSATDWRKSWKACGKFKIV